jgi:hypothetical protein
MRAFAVAIGCLLAAVAGCGSAGPGTGAGGPVTARLAASRTDAAAAGAPVLVSCQGRAQTRPASFVLACADAGDVLTGLRWASWAQQAFGTGTEKINDCTPDCADGTFIGYPALVVAWRPEPRPGHPGQRYFTRITRIYPGRRPPLYHCQGTRTCYPLTSTSSLWSGSA